MNEESKNKSMPSPESNQLHDRRHGRLKCVRDCVMPGLGEFKAGETIDSAELYGKLADHPNFSIATDTEAK